MWQNIWSWLAAGNNGSAVQGLAAVANLLVSLALAVLTGFYVHFTRQQVKLFMQAHNLGVERARHRGKLVVARVRAIVDQLPWDQTEWPIFNQLSLWTNSERAELADALTAVSPSLVSQYSGLLVSLEWIASHKEQLGGQGGVTPDLELYQQHVHAIKTSLERLDVALLK